MAVRHARGVRARGVGGGAHPASIGGRARFRRRRRVDREEFDAVAVLLHASAPAPADAPRRQWAFRGRIRGGGGEQRVRGDAGGVTADLLAVEIDAFPGGLVRARVGRRRGTRVGRRRRRRTRRQGNRARGDPGIHETSSSSRAIVALALENPSTRRDAANGLQVARFTEFSRGALSTRDGSRLASGRRAVQVGGARGGGASALAQPRRRRRRPRHRRAGSRAHRNQTAAGDVGARGGVDGVEPTALRPRGEDGVESGEDGVAATAPSSSVAPSSSAPSSRRKRSLSIGSEMDWGASRERIDEAEALRARRETTDGDAETQPTETTRMETVVEEDSEAMFRRRGRYRTARTRVTRWTMEFRVRRGGRRRRRLRRRAGDDDDATARATRACTNDGRNDATLHRACHHRAFHHRTFHTLPHPSLIGHLARGPRRRAPRRRGSSRTRRVPRTPPSKGTSTSTSFFGSLRRTRTPSQHM